MPNGIATNASFTFTMGSLAPTLNLTMNFASSGSEQEAKSQDIATGSYQALVTSSLSDIRYIGLKNDGSGSIAVATSGSGANPIAYLRPGEGAFIPWSGSVPGTTLFARAYNSGSNLAYVFQEAGFTAGWS